MMNRPLLGLVAAMAIAVQGPDEVPEAWSKKYEAAVQAERSGAFARAELLLQEVVAEAEKLGARDLRLATPLEALGVFYLAEPLRGGRALAPPCPGDPRKGSGAGSSRTGDDPPGIGHGTPEPQPQGARGRRTDAASSDGDPRAIHEQG